MASLSTPCEVDKRYFGGIAANLRLMAVSSVTFFFLVDGVPPRN